MFFSEKVIQKIPKFSVSLDQQSEILESLFLLHAQVEVYQSMLNLRCWRFGFTLYKSSETTIPDKINGRNTEISYISSLTLPLNSMLVLKSIFSKVCLIQHWEWGREVEILKFVNLCHDPIWDCSLTTSISA